MTERTKYWRRHLDRWERSGLSQAAYCRRHGINAVTFAWWKRKLGVAAASSEQQGRNGKRTSSRKRAFARTRASSRTQMYSAPAGSGTSDAKFVEVELSTVGTAAYEVVLSCGVVIRLPADFDPDKVSQLIAVVESATGRTAVESAC